MKNREFWKIILIMIIKCIIKKKKKMKIHKKIMSLNFKIAKNSKTKILKRKKSNKFVRKIKKNLFQP